MCRRAFPDFSKAVQSLTPETQHHVPIHLGIDQPRGLVVRVSDY